MKKTVLLNLLFLLFLISCGNDSGNSAENSEKIINTTISGMAQGPFEKGATVSVYELDTNFQQTGYNIETSIKSDKGDFSVKLRDFESQYILFKVEGYYFNIFTNKKIKDKLTLYALTDLSERDKVNINLLTHLAYNRTQYLVSEKNVPIKKAKKQAENEVLKAFEIEDDFDDAEDIDIFGKGKQSAALLAISVLMQSHLLDASLNDRLADFASDIEKDGTWDNEQIKTEIADWASRVSLNSGFDKVKGYIKKWNQTVDLSAFEKYVENFWQQNYNLGECTDKRSYEVKGNRNKLSNFREEHFICKSNKWEMTPTEEKYPYLDTASNDIAKDGDVRWPNYEKSKCEVFDDTSWRKGNKSECIYGFGGCTKKRESTKIRKREGYYICQNKDWKWQNFEDLNIEDSIPEMPIDCELDTLDWKDTTEGAIRKGNITDIIYIFNNKKWRIATLPEASLGGCNEKTVGNFGYAEKRQGQDMIEPRGYECVVQTHSDECPSPDYGSGYYICEKSYENKYYWETIEYRNYNSICNNPSDDANSKKVNAYWGNFAPAKKKCVNCNQESIDHFEDQCKKRCYASGSIAHASACALGFGGCTKDLYGTLKEGPSIKVGTENIYERYEKYYQLSYLISIDSTQKRTYICRYPYSEGEDYFPTRWYIASDIDIELAPKLCDDWWNSKGVLISGKNGNKYVCDDGGFRIATQEEIEEGIACTEYNMYDLEKCGSELEKQTGMTCAEYMRLVEKCRAKRKE